MKVSESTMLTYANPSIYLGEYPVLLCTKQSISTFPSLVNAGIYKRDTNNYVFVILRIILLSRCKVVVLHRMFVSTSWLTISFVASLCHSFDSSFSETVKFTHKRTHSKNIKPADSVKHEHEKYHVRIHSFITQCAVKSLNWPDSIRVYVGYPVHSVSLRERRAIYLHAPLCLYFHSFFN